MRIHHVAIWTRDIERLSDFYERHFGAKKNVKYTNEKTGFSSYFLRFDDGASLELMNMASIPENENDVEKQYLGLIHIAISLGSKEAVDAKTRALQEEGYALLSGPRWTGDGYYESCVLDPDRNRVEITI
mgnify:CR=1 FL=1